MNTPMAPVQVSAEDIAASQSGVEAVERAFRRRRAFLSQRGASLQVVKRRANYALLSSNNIWMELPSVVTDFIESFSKDSAPFEFEYSWANGRVGYTDFTDSYLVRKGDDVINGVVYVYPDGTARGVPLLDGFWEAFKLAFNRSEEQLASELYIVRKGSSKEPEFRKLLIQFNDRKASNAKPTKL